jgi:hypothetical protein
MKSFDRQYLIWALSYGAAGMALGIYMAASHDHGEFVTHAHIMLVGFVTSLIYAVIHRLWLTAVLLMLVMVLRAGATRPAQGTDAAAGPKATAN